MMVDDALVESLTLAVGDDGDIGQGIDGTQESNKLVHSHFGLGKMVRPPGFEPGSAPWKGAILNQTRLWPQMLKQAVQVTRFKRVAGVSLLDGSVEGLHHTQSRLQPQLQRQKRLQLQFKSVVRVNLRDRLLEGSNHRLIRGSSQPNANRSVEGFDPREEPISRLYLDRSMEGSYHAAKREPSLSDIDGSVEGFYPGEWSHFTACS